MKNQYNFIIGITLLCTVAASYIFQTSRYYSVKTGEEVKNYQFAQAKEKDEFNYLLREESALNYEAGFITGLTSLGLGFLIIGLTRKRKLNKNPG